MVKSHRSLYLLLFYRLYYRLYYFSFVDHIRFLESPLYESKFIEKRPTEGHLKKNSARWINSINKMANDILIKGNEKLKMWKNLYELVVLYNGISWEEGRGLQLGRYLYEWFYFIVAVHFNIPSRLFSSSSNFHSTLFLFFTLGITAAQWRAARRWTRTQPSITITLPLGYRRTKM